MLRQSKRILPVGLTIALIGALAGAVGAEPLPSAAGVTSREFIGGEAKNAVDGRGFSIEAAVDSLYDSNILRDGSGFNNLNGRSRSDFVFTPTATLRGGLPVGRQQLFASAIVGRDFYARNTDFDRTRYNLSGGANLRAGPNCQGSLSAQYREQQGTQLDLVQVTPNVQQDTLIEANAGCGRARGLGFGGGFTRLQTRNGSSLYSLFDSNTSTFNGNLRYNSGPLGSIILTGSYSNVSYPGRAPPLFPSTDGVRVYSGKIAYRRDFGPLLTTDIGVSYIKAEPKLSFFDINGTRTNPGYSGPGFDVTVGYHPGVRLSGTVSATRNVTASANVGALYTVDSNYALDIAYKLSPRLSTGLGGSISTRDYRGSFASAANPVQLLNDTLHRAYAQVTYTPVKRYSVNLIVAQQGRRSNPSTYNYDSTSATLGLRVKF